MKFHPALSLIAVAAAALPIGVAAMAPAEVWEIGPQIRGRNYSVGMPLRPSATRKGEPTFEFPQGGEIDALTTAVGPLAEARRITFRYRVEAARGVRLVSSETPDQPPTVSLYFQQEGDNWSGRGRYASYRWYVPARAVIPLTPGEHSVTVRLDETWTNVNGQPNTRDPQGFAAALANTARIGVAFGTSSARSHGVYATGPARFTLLELDIS
jgi:hypothetical protein